jgi:hypothetical protein
MNFIGAQLMVPAVAGGTINSIDRRNVSGYILS